MAKSLTDRTLTGVNWNIAKTYGKTIVNIVVGIILARILPPEDFGLIGMTVIFTGLADLFTTMGMGASVIKIKNLTNNHIRVATTFTISTSIMVFLIIWFSAPFISDFYNEERLIPIFRTLSLIFIIKGLTTVSYGRIVKKIDFKSILKIELSGFIFGYSLFSIAFAILGFGVWSLVIGRLLSSIISSVFTLIVVPPNLRFLFRKEEFKELFSFGAGISISKLIHYAATNIDYLIIGKFLSPFSLGLYQRSYNLMTLPITKVSSGIYNVLFPAFSEAQNDVKKLQRGYFRTVQSVVFLLFPILTAMMVASEFVILGLYGPNWEGAIDVFQILIIAGFFRATLSYSGAIAHATGRIYAELFQQIMYVTILSTGAYLGVQYGLEGVGVAVVIALFSLFVAQSYLALKIIESNWGVFLRALFPGILISIMVGIFDSLAVFGINELFPMLPPPIKLIVIMVLTCVVFISCILFLPKSFKGDTIEWIMLKYSKRIPTKINNIYFNFNEKL